MSSSSPSDQEESAGVGRTVVVRPPPGLARGKVAAPAWAVVTLGSAIVVAGLAYLSWRWLRKSRATGRVGG